LEQWLRIDGYPCERAIRLPDSHNHVSAGPACTQRDDRRARLFGKGRAIFLDRLPARVPWCSPHHLVSREPEDRLGAGIAGANSALGVQNRDAVLHGRDHRTVALLTLAQRLDGHCVFCDVAESGHASSRTTSRRLEWPTIH